MGGVNGIKRLQGLVIMQYLNSNYKNKWYKF